MHLKTLTLRGFKSFASATTLRLEPGITCVVGPNGSGKSNVVDALAWVMGEQGAKSLRGGKMEDVIFAGTSGRPPLGRAEVALTIDNTDGALPIDYTEVTISRTMFRSGGSEYAINGTACRLLDIQELLSDSGIGREMHVIVGQGQLDAVLHASPEDRRAFIEEAAGVLKHRKRKEKALRKLEAMEANLTRLADLTAEIRRQLKPLGRQAELARRAQVVQADLRDAKARLLADDLVQLTAALEADLADEAAVRARRAEVDEQLASARERLAAAEDDVVAASPQVQAAQERYYRLTSLRDRLRGTGALAADRLRLLADAEPERAPGRDPAELQAQARAVREQEAALAEQVEIAQETLDAASDTRFEAEQAEQAEQQRVAALLRAAADRREGLARLAGQVAAARSRIEALTEQAQRMSTSIAEARARAGAAQAEFVALEAQIAGVEAGEEDLDEAYERADARVEAAREEAAAHERAEREAERDRDTWTARREALELGLRRKDGGGAVLAAATRLSGVLGSVAALVQVEAGYENAVAAALGLAADAVLVEDHGSALAAVEHLREADAGRAALLVTRSSAGGPSGPRPPLPAGARWAADLVRADDAVLPALVAALDGVAVVASLADAVGFVTAAVGPGTPVRAVTLTGDVVGDGLVLGGSATAPSLLEVQAAVDEAAEKVREAGHRAERARFALAAARTALTAATEDAEAALERLHDSDARMSAVAEQLGQLGQTARAAAAEAARQESALEASQRQVSEAQLALGELEARLEAAEETAEEEPSTARRDELAARATAARAAEMEARLALRTAEERARALAGRADSLERAAEAELQAREAAAARARRRRHQAEAATSVLSAVEQVVAGVEQALAEAAAARADAEQQRQAADRVVVAARTQAQALAEEQARLVDSVHRDELARAQQRARIETLRQRSADELGMDPEVLVDEYGPDRMVPVVGETDPDGEAITRPYVRAEQEKRLRAAERGLAQLGTVNPLALEEFAALEERHRFLNDQLDDLRSTRRDLMDIVKEVDAKVEQVFTEAFHDTAAQFEGVFARLFPGGEGRLILTDPDNMLTTGLDVEARPPGKKVKRLSLLSGGERSLTAVALLVAIFKARPSPFYVMDEVEAALDDTNLGRLISIFEELRESSQLIVITHQKRTMEVADALYGVTMRGDGVTTVISQRLREESAAPA
ncbi:MAG: chromosome segregation protein SMC [Kineosporiaceae bacterium]